MRFNFMEKNLCIISLYKGKIDFMANIISNYEPSQIELLLCISWLVIIIDYIFHFYFLFFGGLFRKKLFLVFIFFRGFRARYIFKLFCFIQVSILFTFLYLFIFVSFLIGLLLFVKLNLLYILILCYFMSYQLLYTMIY